jgi:hypothetical protein
MRSGKDYARPRFDCIDTLQYLRSAHSGQTAHQHISLPRYRSPPVPLSSSGDSVLKSSLFLDTKTLKNHKPSLSKRRYC